MVVKERDASREDFWRRVLQRRTDSGMTIAKFCAAEGLKATTYHYWQREIRRRDSESQSVDSSSEPALVPLQIVEDRDDMAAVEIVARNGFVVRVSEQATTEHVRRVLQAVGELG